MKRVLVTGGAGFIGSHLCESLLKKDYEVICLDNFFTGSKKNIVHLMQHPYFELIRHDITHPIFVEVDEIYNLACPASPVHYQLNAIKTIKTNVMGTIHVLGMAKRVKAKILQASTSEVYGSALVHPQPESYWGNVNPIGVRSCYDEGKRCSEALCMDYKRQNDVDVKIARIFNTFGPKMQQNDGRAVSNFIVQALKNEDITIYGSGNQTRSFMYIDDLIEGLIKLMNTEKGYAGPVNLGNTHEISMLELAQIIITLSGSNSKIIHLPALHDDPPQRKPDITLAKQKLAWEPIFNISEGLTKTIEYFKYELNLE
jgi:UDP-glucuronate decarboxylase